MQQSTFKDPKVQELLNTHFYFISFNAEYKDDIRFHNHSYTYRPGGVHTGIHELASSLLDSAEQKTYPAIVIMDPDYNIRLQQTGYLGSKEILLLLRSVIVR